MFKLTILFIPVISHVLLKEQQFYLQSNFFLKNEDLKFEHGHGLLSI